MTENDGNQDYNNEEYQRKIYCFWWEDVEPMYVLIDEPDADKIKDIRDEYIDTTNNSNIDEFVEWLKDQGYNAEFMPIHSKIYF